MANPDHFGVGSGSYARPDAGRPAGGGASSAAGADPLASGNPYGSYVGSPPSDSFSSRSARDLNGHHSAPYPAGGDLNGHHSAPYPAGGDLSSYHSAPYPATPDLDHRGGSYPAASELNGRHSAPYLPAPDLDRRGGSDPAADYRDGRRDWYPPRGDNPLSYPAENPRGGYPASRPGPEGYLPAVGYPAGSAAPRAQDPYAQDGDRRRPGY